MRRHRRRSRGGFSIIELLIAIFVITIALLGTVAAIAYGLRASRLGSENSVAIQINRKITEILLQGIVEVSDRNTYIWHSPGNPRVARATSTWRPVTIENSGGFWFNLDKYGYPNPTAPEALEFLDKTRTFEVDVAAENLPNDPLNLSVNSRFPKITIQTRWLEKDTGNWKFVATETYGIAR